MGNLDGMKAGEISFCFDGQMEVAQGGERRARAIFDRIAKPRVSLRSPNRHSIR
jgi:hypothetical protein